MIEARFSVVEAGKPRPSQGAAASAFAPNEPTGMSSRALKTNTALTRASFSLMALLLDLAAVLAASMLADVAYNSLAHGRVEICAANLQLGLFAAILFIVLNVTRHSYAVADYLDISGHAQRTFSQWNIAFLAAATFGFLARVIEDSSRGAFIVFYVAGLFALYAWRAALVRVMQHSARKGGVLASRVLIVGFERDVAEFSRIYQPARQGMGVVATPILRESPETLAADLAAATETARRLMPDDIIVVIPWAKAEVIDQCVTALMRVERRPRERVVRIDVGHTGAPEVPLAVHRQAEQRRRAGACAGKRQAVEPRFAGQVDQRRRAHEVHAGEIRGCRDGQIPAFHAQGDRIARRVAQHGAVTRGALEQVPVVIEQEPGLRTGQARREEARIRAAPGAQVDADERTVCAPGQPGAREFREPGGAGVGIGALAQR